MTVLPAAADGQAFPLEFLGQRQRVDRVALFILMALSFAHVVHTWGFIEFVWGDTGRWLHEVDRAINGEVVYRDFYWPFPPLAIWVLAALGKVLGNTLHVIWFATSSIYVLVMLASFYLVTALLQRQLVFPTVLSVFLLGTSYGSLAGTSLPMGSYTPAAPLGFLFLVLTILCMVRLLRSPAAMPAAAVGFFAGLCILTKQDFWIPAVYVSGISASLTWVGHRRGSMLAVLVVASFAATVFAGALAVAASSSWVTVMEIPGGFGIAAEFIGRVYPSWRRVTTELVAASALGSAAVLLLSPLRTNPKGRRWLLALLACAAVLSFVYLYVTVEQLAKDATQTASANALFTASAAPRLGRFPHLLPALIALKKDLQRHFFPLILPFGVFLLVWQCRKRPGRGLHNTVLVFLGLCITLRLRRLFHSVDWYNLMLEIPTYALAVQYMVPQTRERMGQLLKPALYLLLAAGVYSCWDLTLSPWLERAGTVALHSDKGTAWVTRDAALELKRVREAVDKVDPSGSRPLFCFGYSGGYNYFLGRKNPTPWTIGFSFSSAPERDPRSTILSYSPSPLLLDNSAFADATQPAAALDFTRWDLERVPNRHLLSDRRQWAEITASCREAPRVLSPLGPVYTLFDCALPEKREASPRPMAR